MFSLKNVSTKECSACPRDATLVEYLSGFFSGGSSELGDSDLPLAS